MISAFYGDSLSWDLPTGVLDDVYGNIRSVLTIHGLLAPTDAILVTKMDTPQQPVTSLDCGPYTLLLAEHIALHGIDPGHSLCNVFESGEASQLRRTLASLLRQNGVGYGNVSTVLGNIELSRRHLDICEGTDMFNCDLMDLYVGMINNRSKRAHVFGPHAITAITRASKQARLPDVLFKWLRMAGVRIGELDTLSFVVHHGSRQHFSLLSFKLNCIPETARLVPNLLLLTAPPSLRKCTVTIEVASGSDSDPIDHGPVAMPTTPDRQVGCRAHRRRPSSPNR